MSKENTNSAVYGTGDNARILLEKKLVDNYCCVISDNVELKDFCGRKVFSLRDAIKIVDNIIIAAVPVSTGIVYNRIKDELPSNMPVYDIRGHYLNEEITAKEYINRFIKNDVDMEYYKKLTENGRFSDGKYYIDCYDAVAALIAPITILFLSFIHSFARGYDHILFPSRDGYFLLKMYRNLFGVETDGMATAHYLLTSRDAVNNRDDNYRKYLKSLNTSGKNAIVDIVTQGTVVAGVSDILDRKMDLIAMGTTELPNNYIDDMKRVHSLLGQINERKGDIRYSFDDFSELHLFLEILYASCDGQFVRIDNSGCPEYKENEYSEELLVGVQNCLVDMISEYDLHNGKTLFSTEFAKSLLRLFYKKFAMYDEKIRNKFMFDDPYDERMQSCNLIDKLGW